MPRQLKLVHFATLLILSVFAFSTNSIASQKDGLLKIHFLDVGQGDSIFVETPSGRQVLIDGGPGNIVLSRLGEVMPFFDKTIDIVVMTHPDADHASGLIDVIKRYNVENVVFSNIVNNKELYKSWKEAVSDEGANIIDSVLGNVIDLGDGANLTIVYPLESIAGKEIEKTNDNSAVLILKYGELEVLLTGDIETKGERAMLLENVNINADVLKIGHHGSKTSTSEEFLSAVSPEVAVIQVGAKNRYGHPTEEVLERLENYDINIYRNDLNGDIKLVSDGVNYLISSQK
jgi:competence protein ComEC